MPANKFEVAKAAEEMAAVNQAIAQAIRQGNDKPLLDLTQLWFDRLRVYVRENGAPKSTAAFIKIVIFDLVPTSQGQRSDLMRDKTEE